MSAPDGVGRAPFGIAAGIGAVAMVVAAQVAAVLFGPAEVWARLVVVAVGLTWYAASVADVWASLATVGLGYLLFNGFLVGRFGELAWRGAASVWHLLALLVAVGVGIGWRRVWTAVGVTRRLGQRVVVERHSTVEEAHGGGCGSGVVDGRAVRGSRSDREGGGTVVIRTRFGGGAA
jgi:hypothetical protein